MAPPDHSSGSTPTRRARNAASQRAYRAKQKARLEQLERLAIEARAPVVPTSAVAPAAAELLQQPQLLLAGPSSGNLPTLEFSSYDVRRTVSKCSAEERNAVRWIIVTERFTIRDLIKFGLIQSGHAMDTQLFESSQDTSARSWLEKVKGAVGDVDLKTVVKTGIRLLASLDVPWDQINSESASRVMSMDDILGSNVHSDRILLSRESSAAAMFANASHLNIPIDDVLGPDAEYPTRRQDDAHPDLLPTANQITIPHHPCFDTLPWAIFRSNICFAISQDPPLIDDEELCLDIMNDGIRCWGSSKQSLTGRGDGVPWDARSWEAAPWFLEKWEPLTGGRNSEIWRNSAWWRSIR